jgi:hypothetical protein
VIDCFCIGLGSFGLGLFLALFLFGWFEERSDRYDRIVFVKKWEGSPYKFP